MTESEKTMNTEADRNMGENEISMTADTAGTDNNILDSWMLLLPLSVINSFLAIQGMTFNNSGRDIPVLILAGLFVTAGFTIYLYVRKHCLMRTAKVCFSIGHAIGNIFGTILFFIPGIDFLIAWGIGICSTILMIMFVFGFAYALPIVFIPILSRVGSMQGARAAKKVN